MIVKISHPDSIFEGEVFKEQYSSMVDRYFLMCSHPRKIVFDTVGAIWATYFLWNNNWQVALIIYVVMAGLGLFFTRKIDPELLSQTTIGKIGLLHTHPINITLNLIGIILLINGLWGHEGVVILLGISLVIMGHFFGWSKVNSKLRMV